LTHDVFGEVTLIPVLPAPGGRHVFGAWGPDERFVDAFAHPWCQPALARLGSAPERFETPVVYGGMAMNHFGHFVLEALSRLWFLRDRPELPILWHWIDLPVPHSAWEGWMDQVMALVGLGQRRNIMLRAPVFARQIIVPRHGFQSCAFLHPDQASALAVVVGDAGAPGGRIWLSRRGLPPQFGGVEGEEALEALLSARGWTVLEPEALTVAQKAGLFAAADIVSGFAQSAFHAVLLQAAPRARLRPVIRPSVTMQDYEIVAAARGLDFAAITADLTETVARASWSNYRLENAAALAEAVDGA